VERPKNPITAARRAIFWEIEGVERAEQEGKGGTVGIVGCRLKGNFKTVRLRLIDCATRRCFRLESVTSPSRKAVLIDHEPS
jgi:hypothetical protein